MNDFLTNNDPPEPGRRFSLEQYEMLRRCSDRKDMTEWNDWREKYFTIPIKLEGAKLYRLYLEGANLHKAFLKGAKLKYAHLNKASLNITHLEGADLFGAHLEEANLYGAHLEGTDLQCSHLEGAKLLGTHLEGAQFNTSIVDGETFIDSCTVDQNTDFRGVGLDSIRIYTATKELLKCNNRRLNWKDWYEENSIYKSWFVKAFWWLSDYGSKTGKIFSVFFILALFFTIIYYGCEVHNHSVVSYLVEKDGIPVPYWLVPIRALYFSVVTMTTLGFGDIFAYPDSLAGHILLTLQVLLGYVLIGTLVTRFAVLFTAGGPAGSFSEEYKKKESEKNK